MRDLSELMCDAFEVRARSLDGLTPAAGVAGLRSRVRRRRVVRHSVQVVAALPVVAALAVGAWYLGGERGPEPVATPGPTVSPEPSPTRSPEPDAGALIERPGLPPYYEMPDGLLDETGPGWLITAHQPGSNSGPGGTYVSEAYALFLVAPDGTHYLAAEFQPDANVFPVAWEAGASRVEVIVDTVTAGLADERPDEDLMPAWLDLRTGRLAERNSTEAGWPPANVQPLPRSPSGLEVGGLEFTEFFTLWAVDGTGLQLAYQVPGTCAPVGWLDDEAFLALCIDASEGELAAPWLSEEIRSADPRLFRIGVVGGEATATVLRSIGAEDPLPEPGQGVWVRDGVVAFPSLGETVAGEAVAGSRLPCWTGVDAWENGDFVSVHRPADAGRSEYVKDLRAQGGLVYVEAAPGCTSAVHFALTGHDVTTGGAVVLAPAPGGDWTRALVAWAVAE